MTQVPFHANTAEQETANTPKKAQAFFALYIVSEPVRSSLALSHRYGYSPPISLGRVPSGHAASQISKTNHHNLQPPAALAATAGLNKKKKTKKKGTSSIWERRGGPQDWRCIDVRDRDTTPLVLSRLTRILAGIVKGSAAWARATPWSVGCSKESPPSRTHKHTESKALRPRKTTNKNQPKAA